MDNLQVLLGDSRMEGSPLEEEDRARHQGSQVPALLEDLHSQGSLTEGTPVLQDNLGSLQQKEDHHQDNLQGILVLPLQDQQGLKEKKKMKQDTFTQITNCVPDPPGGGAPVPCGELDGGLCGDGVLVGRVWGEAAPLIKCQVLSVEFDANIPEVLVEETEQEMGWKGEEGRQRWSL